MMAGLCGLCTWNVLHSGNPYDGHAFAPIFGGVPTLAGVFMFLVGLVRLLGSRKR
jgi:hypothetical protein